MCGHCPGLYTALTFTRDGQPPKVATAKGLKGLFHRQKVHKKLYLSKVLNANGSIGMCLKEEQTDDKVARVTLRNTRRTADKAPDTSDLNVLTSWPSEAGS